ncbi:4668_t:CDS:1, partial [Ambispora leptoticha]
KLLAEDFEDVVMGKPDRDEYCEVVKFTLEFEVIYDGFNFIKILNQNMRNFLAYQPLKIVQALKIVDPARNGDVEIAESK